MPSDDTEYSDESSGEVENAVELYEYVSWIGDEIADAMYSEEEYNSEDTDEIFWNIE